MTIIEAIQRADSYKPNQFTQEDKVRWLSILDSNIYEDLIKTHEDADPAEFNGYTVDTPLSKALLVPDRYAQEVYVAYLSAQIDYYNDEITRYNNDMQAYNAAYGEYAAWYNRTHRPLPYPNITTFSSGRTAPSHLPWPLQTRGDGE